MSHSTREFAPLYRCAGLGPLMRMGWALGRAVLKFTDLGTVLPVAVPLDQPYRGTDICPCACFLLPAINRANYAPGLLQGTWSARSFTRRAFYEIEELTWGIDR